MTPEELLTHDEYVRFKTILTPEEQARWIELTKDMTWEEYAEHRREVYEEQERKSRLKRALRTLEEVTAEVKAMKRNLNDLKKFY